MNENILTIEKYGSTKTLTLFGKVVALEKTTSIPPLNFKLSFYVVKCLSRFEIYFIFMFNFLPMQSSTLQNSLFSFLFHYQSHHLNFMFMYYWTIITLPIHQLCKLIHVRNKVIKSNFNFFLCFERSPFFCFACFRSRYRKQNA